MWFGNAAKWRVLKSIPDGAAVLDFGAGTGESASLLRKHLPNCEVFLFEPDPVSRAKLQERVGSNAVHIADLKDLRWSNRFDHIISFSVFEHVFDRLDYLRTAQRTLRPRGVLHLNYDDGHFRHWLDLGNSSTWRSAAATLVLRAAAPLMMRLGRPHHYLSRVMESEVRDLIQACGLELVADRYENIESLKDAAKSVPESQARRFMETWVALEDAVNEMLPADARSAIFLSRTLTLRKP